MTALQTIWHAELTGLLASLDEHARTCEACGPDCLPWERDTLAAAWRRAGATGAGLDVTGRLLEHERRLEQTGRAG